MKIGSVAKLDKRNMATSKMFDDGGMSANCDDIVIFPIYGQVEAIWKLDMWSLTETFYLAKSESRSEKSLTTIRLLL